MQEIMIDPTKGAITDISDTIYDNGFMIAHRFSPWGFNYLILLLYDANLYSEDTKIYFDKQLKLVYQVELTYIINNKFIQLVYHSIAIAVFGVSHCLYYRLSQLVYHQISD